MSNTLPWRKGRYAVLRTEEDKKGPNPSQDPTKEFLFIRRVCFIDCFKKLFDPNFHFSKANVFPFFVKLVRLNELVRCFVIGDESDIA